MSMAKKRSGKKIKIAVVASGHIPSQFAHSINTIKHAEAFSELGYITEVLSVKRFYENKYINQIENIFDWYGVNNLKINYFVDRSVFYLKEIRYISRFLKIINTLTNGKFQNFLCPEKKISHFVNKNNFDFCFARTYKTVLYNIENKIPTIMETHNPSPENNYDLSKILKLSSSKYFRGIVTIHEKLKTKYTSLGDPRKKVLILEDAVNLANFDNINDDIMKNRNEVAIPFDKKIIL